MTYLKPCLDSFIFFVFCTATFCTPIATSAQNSSQPQASSATFRKPNASANTSASGRAHFVDRHSRASGTLSSNLT
ncbi:MAG: hypothetical protein LBS29_01100 [Endomicrobium sp.]|nr:hypothetical protein [Endomicrobium sp.]